MAATRDLPIWPERVVGAKHVHAIERLVEHLRQDEPHGNRDLFLDDGFVAYLLAFFNPALRTLRTIEDFSQTRQAQKHLSIPKLCKSTWLPELLVIPENGESEAKTAQDTITPGAIHIYDRGIFSFELIQAHVPKAADFVMRIREPGPRCPKLETVETCELTQEARDAGVTSDRLVRLAGSTHRKAPDIVLREVVIVSPDDPEHPVYLLTTLLDLDASVIGLLYRNRWQIELFFRWLKCYARFDHLISHSREGVLLNFYVAVVGVTLMYIHTGHRPSKYLFIMMGMVASGSATLEEVMPILRERERQSKMQRDRVARKRAEKSK